MGAMTARTARLRVALTATLTFAVLACLLAPTPAWASIADDIN